MRIVKCYECGKRYNYDEDGFCPKCGGFNQPKALSRIGADGSVVWVDGIDRRNHEGSFVHQELHEENRERRGSPLERGQSRRKTVVTRSAPVQKVLRQPLAGRDGRPVHHAATKKRQEGGSALLWIIAAVIFLLNLLT